MLASFSEVKKVIYQFFEVPDSIPENANIASKINSDIIALKNDALQNLYNRVAALHSENLELYDGNSRECAVQYLWSFGGKCDSPIRSEDKINGIEYSIVRPSYEYRMFILQKIADHVRENGDHIVKNIKAPWRHATGPVFQYDGETGDSLELLNSLFPVSTIQVKTNSTCDATTLKRYSGAFEFELMYISHKSIHEYQSIIDLFHLSDSFQYQSPTGNNFDPPRRTYNQKVISYYSMALESIDPFTQYISFYHIIEHYFDVVFRKTLVENIMQKITYPDFSYKNEEQIYDLAKYIRKHMSSDEESGKGNEFESLKYVLKEYITDINALQTRINSFSSNAVAYYQNNSVVFVTKSSTKIGWSDQIGVYSNLANRIYLTRNALIHSKSEMEDNLYKPYEHRQELIKEIPLIRAVAETIIIQSSDSL